MGLGTGLALGLRIGWILRIRLEFTRRLRIRRKKTKKQKTKALQKIIENQKISEFSSAFKRIYDIAQFVIETLPRPPTS